MAEQTKDAMDRELAALEIEERKLRLEHLRMTVENERARRDGIIRAHQAQQKSLDDANAMILAQQKQCRHHKGGTNLQGILNGKDFNYSVTHHTYPWGEIGVMCTRCGKEWREPKADLKKSDPKEYKSQLAEYVEALNFPTDNEPSGTQLFMITQLAQPKASA